jgi:probable sporulation protein (polysaccharide deacetylase family)
MRQSDGEVGGMKKRSWKPYAFVLGSAALLSLIVHSQPVDHYMSVVKMNSVEAVSPGEEDLRKQIEQWKLEREEPPVDARLDRIWKAIPGYNGRVIDVEASLARLRREKNPSPEMLVYREAPPAVGLEQLGAHPIYRGNPKKPAISFMVNVAWGNEYLDKMLDTLDKHQVKTTFFLDGSWVKRFPDLAKKIAERGHEIGNHAYSHPDMGKLGPERIRQEIGRTQKVIEQAVGIKPTLFAPPSGAYNQQVVTIAHNDFHMKTILWTADTVDWQRPSVQTLIHRVEAKLENGVLVLMHPTASSAEGLDQLIRLARTRGLTPTTVSEVISSSRLSGKE